MESNEDYRTSEITIRELYENEKKEKKRKTESYHMKKYLAKPGVKERLNKRNQTKRLVKTLKKFGRSNPHKVCKKLGHTIAWGRYNPGYSYKCTGCNVSYSDKESKHFYKGNKCPCCHRLLRTRKTIAEKRKGDV